MKTEVVFFGTHNFAAKILQGLIDSPDFNVGLVITQPDQPVGRKKEWQACPVKILAEKNNLKIKQPVSLKDFNDDLSSFVVAVVAQYGKIIPAKLLNMPKKGMVNVHASLLPKYRGASPIQTAILNGDILTGISLIKMDETMDTGPILTKKEIPINPNETYPELEAKLADLATPLLLQSLPLYLSGKLQLQAQDNRDATYTKILKREDGQINFKQKAEQIYNQWRAFFPWPGIFWETKLNFQSFKIKLLKIQQTDLSTEQPAGSLIALSKNRLGVVGGDKKILEILELQAENKNPMTALEFINGFKVNQIKDI